MKQELLNVRYLISEVDPSRLEKARSEVAFVGRSNCGKSSVINALCHNQKVARVSQTPGCTRTINVYEAGEWSWLVDLPGYGYASGPEESRQGWSAMIEGYLTSRPQLRCVFLIADAKVGATKLDQEMARWLIAHGLPFRVLANKCDQVKSSQVSRQKLDIAATLNILPEKLSWISARDKIGIKELRQDVVDLLNLRD